LLHLLRHRRGRSYTRMKAVISGKECLTMLTACCCLLLLFVSSTVPAGTSEAKSSIFLNEREKKLVQNDKVVVRELESQGKPGRTFEAVSIINANRGIIRQILVDYEKYPDFMPNVSEIEVIHRKDKPSILLNYTLSLPLGKTKQYRVSMEESEPNRKTSLIQWRFQEWPGLKEEDTIKDTDGFWRIEELDQGRSLVLYHMYVDPGPIPFGLGWIVDILSKESVPDALLQSKIRAEKMQ
jgi:hypothetical protein